MFIRAVIEGIGTLFGGNVSEGKGLRFRLTIVATIVVAAIVWIGWRPRFRNGSKADVRIYLSLLTFNPSAFARAWIDSSLRVIALLIALRLIPLPASR